ncbi:MAG TPA: hypothetical protein DCR60_12175, partial [Psychrobacter sp.]|nr:hypothetical protein [Psychrobacter sp.]
MVIAKLITILAKRSLPPHKHLYISILRAINSMVNVLASSPVDDKKARLKHLIQRLPNLPGVYKM